MNFDNVIQAFTQADWKEAALALLAGAVLGYVFAKVNVPIPAPPVLAGILGIVGVWLGFLLGK